ncbi:hypothetical protein CLU79DRAFT_784828 [Phycomyces nitens]|nr:hypothetical protein CLU79DRAFT_784828 [Phycomyces nitens]
MSKSSVHPLSHTGYFGSKLTAVREETLKAVLGTFLAPLTDEEKECLKDKLAKIPSATSSSKDIDVIASLCISTPGVYDTCITFMSGKFPPRECKDIFMVIDALSSAIGTYTLTGYYSRFADLNKEKQAAACLAWRFSKISKIRSIHVLFSTVATAATYNMTGSAHQAAIKCSGIDQVRASPNYRPVIERERYKMMTLEELVQPDLKFDAIIIGSGAGGGVCAAELSQAGMSVLVIEKGKYYHESELSLDIQTSLEDMYEQKAPFLSRNGTLAFFAGSTFGGGTAINFGASLKTQSFVREEWAKKGLGHFTSTKFSDDLEKVCQILGAETSGIKHCGGNQVLIDGCKKLGYDVQEIPQNTGGRPHECGWCYAGCKDGIKNSTANSWLRIAEKHGARFVDNTKVNRVLIADGRAVGVECQMNGSKKMICISGSRVIVSSGALNSPGVLLKSGIKNKNIGRHLYVHCAAGVNGVFDDRQINSSDGSIMTAMTNVFENVNGDHYGPKLEGFHSDPGTFAVGIPWLGTREHKEIMLRRRQTSSILVMIRDKNSKGSVGYDEAGRIDVSFKLSKNDRRSLVKGIEGAAMVLCGAGAREIHTGLLGVKPFVFEPKETVDVSNLRFKQWTKDLRTNGFPDNGGGIVSAHQMGTCRMGTSPKTSVTRPTGEVWGVENLYVCDTSLFPTSSGVNPMVTCQAIALHVADSIIKK